MNLRDVFNSLVDEELLRRVSVGGLTEEALTLALSELAARGLSDPRMRDGDLNSQSTESVELIVLERGLPPDEAQSLAGGLQSAGIPYAYGGIRRALMDRRAVVVSVDLLVHPAHFTDAQEALAAYRRGDLAIDENFDPSANA